MIKRQTHTQIITLTTKHEDKPTSIKNDEESTTSKQDYMMITEIYQKDIPASANVKDIATTFAKHEDTLALTKYEHIQTTTIPKTEPTIIKEEKLQQLIYLLF